MIKTSCVAVLIAGFAVSAQAECLTGERTFMSCQIEDKTAILRVCFTNTDIHYRYGPRGSAPELSITETIGTVNYRPWNGVGRSIVEEVEFQTGRFAYRVYAGFERIFDEEEYEDIAHRQFGGVRVFEGDAEIATLLCERKTVDFAWEVELFEAKEGLGFVWDHREREWVELPD